MVHRGTFPGTIFVDGQDISKDQIVYDTIHGFLPGGFFGGWLGGIIFVEVTRIVSKLSPEQSPIKFALWGLLVLQVAYCSIFGAFLIHSTVGVFGNFPALNKIPLLLGVHAFLSRFLTTASQAFMAVRVWNLTSRNSYLLATILLCSIYHFAVSLAVGQRFLTAKYYHKLMRPKFLWQMMYSAEILVDSIITISLSMNLTKKRCKTKKYSTRIREIVLLAIESAFVATPIAIASLALMGKVGLGTLYSFSYVSAQAYVLAVLVGLKSWLNSKIRSEKISRMRPAKPVPSSRPHRTISDADFGKSILEIATIDEGIPEQARGEGTTDASAGSVTPENGKEKTMVLED
ncbi:hypothetical protein CROQUDRAFT_714746 [Cronartium quercuum f. sp. fusiforme G11]|uniref:Uncharacterized protein n=1 Tax=Cronartium quercuum f. sp. fusiforme G11 TaxID=708437 RepID=A0A9P6NPS0_9BASI|nr:hypothetical protein CROQUDRAFT_714746 [Cronartium quercuum f. sp. fusiforme G11]